MMIKIIDYINENKMTELCRKINLPDEVRKKVILNLKECDFTPLEPVFSDLFDISKGKAAFERIEAYFNKEQYGIKDLTVYLMAAQYTKEIYNKKNINDKIYTDTMKMFSRFVNEHMTSYNTYGFDRGFWVYRILSASLFRLGELEYELRGLGIDINGYAQKGEPVISVHIPSDAILTRENINESYNMAYEFLSNYFDDFKYKFLYTNTWLLSPELKSLLPETSKILLFQSYYNIVIVDTDDQSFMEWVYKRNYDNYSELPEKTSLQRNIKKHLLSGGKIGSAFGILNTLSGVPLAIPI